jgi:alkaline phosphatase D
MAQQYLSNQQALEQPINSLELVIHTGDANFGDSDDDVYCNVVFTDGSLLFVAENFRLSSSDPNERERGKTDNYVLPVPPGLDKKIGDISEIYVRKAGEDAWFLGSALLFANSLNLPVIGNSQINQYIDKSKNLLYFSDWSSRSLGVPNKTPARLPMLGAYHRIAGPVLGHVSATSANVQYRVEREGRYRLVATQVGSVPPQVAFDQTAQLSPTACFRITGLTPNTHYSFQLSLVVGSNEVRIPEADGDFRTFPPEDTGVHFTFSFGSCSRNRDDQEQPVWMAIRSLAADPSIDATADAQSRVRFFVHLGDTFYFHDDVTEEEPKTLAAAQAGNLVSRKHPGFLEMARCIPSIAIWDDHDFRKNDSPGTNFPGKDESLAAFNEYWPNELFIGESGLTSGMTTRLTYGNVDIYLMDGRFHRDPDHGVCFSMELLRDIAIDIRSRLATGNRMVILASGSTWNHTNTEGEDYGADSAYEVERDSFYRQLQVFIGNGSGHGVHGLVFISGDIHLHEIYQISLDPANNSTKVAPEFVSSPHT